MRIFTKKFRTFDPRRLVVWDKVLKITIFYTFPYQKVTLTALQLQISLKTAHKKLPNVFSVDCQSQKGTLKTFPGQIYDGL